ncbi:MAG: hypothetical protein E7057_01405 [Lentisphaerae bacterium]|nr:hypothetical protein [Lentisphaerota bacterium]
MDNTKNTSNEPEKKPKSPASLKKKLLKIFAGIFLFLLIVLTLLILFIEPVIKTAVTNIGPQIAGVPFELEDISVSLLRGRVEIKNLLIGNPEGYGAEYAVKLGDVAVQTDLLSWIGSGKAIIREIRLKDITVNYETAFPLSTDSNLNTILENVKKVAPQQKNTEPAPEKTADTPQKNLQLDKLIIDNVRLVVIPKGHPEFGVPLIVTLPELGPVGTEPEGTPGPDIAVELFTELLDDIVQSVKNSSKEIYRTLSDQGLKLTDDLVKGAKDLGSNISETTGDTAKKISDGAGNLWNSIRGK